MNETVEKMVDLMQSGLVGLPLLYALREQFGKATRDEVFMAVATAITLCEANLMLYEDQRKRDAA